MPAQNGGKRPGAGRPRKTDKHAGQIAAFEKRAADSLPERFENLTYLANGGYERVKEKWVPAGLVFKDETTLDDKGRPLTVKVPAFPDLGPEVLVLIEKITEIAEPDRASNVYLTDRAMGKPTERIEHNGDYSQLTDAELEAIVKGTRRS